MHFTQANHLHKYELKLFTLIIFYIKFYYIYILLRNIHLHLLRNTAEYKDTSLSYFVT